MGNLASPKAKRELRRQGKVHCGPVSWKLVISDAREVAISAT